MNDCFFGCYKKATTAETTQQIKHNQQHRKQQQQHKHAEHTQQKQTMITNHEITSHNRT